MIAWSLLNLGRTRVDEEVLPTFFNLLLLADREDSSNISVQYFYIYFYNFNADCSGDTWHCGSVNFLPPPHLLPA